MRIGYATRDITPGPGLTLSGFAARCNRPAEGVDDPISVSAIAAEDGSAHALVLSFDLLGLGPELDTLVDTAVRQRLGGRAFRQYRVATHTHGAPAAVTLLGCGIPDMTYWHHVADMAARAAEDAVHQLRPAVVRWTTVPLPGYNRNRRHLLPDGSVRMTVPEHVHPAKRGPTWDTALLVRFDDTAGHPIAGIIHWAAHPDTVSSMQVTADFPGELRRRLAARHGLPFVYLQGACGNLNPPFRRMVREEMLENVDRLMAPLGTVAWPAAPATDTPFAAVSIPFSLPYGPAMSPEALTAFIQDMTEAARTGTRPAAAIATLSDILNTEPGQPAKQTELQHFARIMLEWAACVREAPIPPRVPCTAGVWRLGGLAFCFAGVEPFAETALALSAACPGTQVALVGYASPLLGYLPTDEALADGGYEADYAYRFYAHPAAWAPGSEASLVAALADAVTKTAQRA